MLVVQCKMKNVNYTFCLLYPYLKLAIDCDTLKYK